MDLSTHSVTTYILALGVPFVPIAAFFAWEYSLGKTKEPSVQRGCKRLGFAANEELTLPGNQSGVSRTQSEGSKGTADRWRIKALVIYPIKSCFPVMLEYGQVIPTGLRYDRQFSFAEMVPVSKTDREKPNFSKDYEGKYHWKFITQREYPLLTKVKTELWVPDENSPTYSSKEPNVANGGCLVVSFPDPVNNNVNVSFQVPFDPSESRIKRMKYPEETMQIWVDFPQALNMTSEIPAIALSKLKEFLSSQKLKTLGNLALFRVDSGRENKQLREVYRCAPKKEDIGYQPVVGFADAYPLHMLNMSSIDDLATHLRSGAGHLDPRRFRANLYIEGPEAFAEDKWKLIRIGDSRYHVSSRTARCLLPNVDPETGIKDQNEPRRAMDQYRKVDEGCPKVPCLGMQVTPMQAASQIKVGDEIELLETGEHFYLSWPTGK
ncbi:MAG: hypothetical protein Q9165_002561 [Trypethelium subeluteriae]